MRFTVEAVAYDFDPKRVTFAEGKAMEKVTGLTFQEIGKAAETGSMLAMQAFLWVAMKRTRPELRFADLDQMSVADFDFSAGELAEASEEGAQVAPVPPGRVGAAAAAAPA